MGGLTTPAKLLPLETPIAGCGMVCSFVPPMYAACTAAVSRKSMVLLAFALPSLPCCSVHPSLACVDRHLLAGGAPLHLGSCLQQSPGPGHTVPFFAYACNSSQSFPQSFPLMVVCVWVHPVLHGVAVSGDLEGIESSHARLFPLRSGFVGCALL
jgi:hypothetical protein